MAQRRALRLSGVVQGVGMRPYLHRLATEMGLVGLVGNDAHGVFCEVEGEPSAVEQFVARVRAEPPALAVIESIEQRSVPPTGEPGFVIVASSSAEPGDGRPVALVPPDTATCVDCLAEMRDPDDRRYRYPFIACTFCGPRFTIVRGVPYDRPFTTMDSFVLCAPCQAEYDDPADRRFHAQPTACPTCGPQLTFRTKPGATATSGDGALAAATRVLRDGGIVAVKGVGGYHLACDATRPDVVQRLRERKRRSAKPFALLAADLDTARSLVDLDGASERVLTSAQAPIVLAPARLDDPAVRALRDSVAPRQARLGVMLPYSGLHHLLTDAHPDVPGDPVRCLVLTSANLSDEPLCTEPDEAERRLADIADAWLHHDRPVHLACDDSVVAAPSGQPIRRSRGYAPVPVRLPVDVAPTLAVGGELKATVCLAEGRRGWLSQHLGDVASLEALALLERTVDVLQAQSRVAPQVVVADSHPGYLSRRWATDHAAMTGARLVLVQHHHAHLGSLLAEYQRPPDEPVIGVTFDGTGYGTDGSIWGGEVLLGSYLEVRRVAHLAPVALPGGDAAIEHPARVALSHLRSAGLGWDERLPTVAAVAAADRQLLGTMLESGSGCVPTTSMGRLFDAISSLAGVCQHVGYEGQAAVELEALLVGAPDDGEYRFVIQAGTSIGPLAHDAPMLIDPAPVLGAAVRDVLAGVPAPVVSGRFHRAVALAVVDVARMVREATGVGVVGLTGGVFQNVTLTDRCTRLLREDRFDVLVHRRVPANDGGLALGQAMIAGLDAER